MCVFMKKSGKSLHIFEIAVFRLKLAKIQKFDACGGHLLGQGNFEKFREISMFFNEKSGKIVSFEQKVRVEKF